MQGRGLKLVNIINYYKIDLVAPHAGAWIETLDLYLKLCNLMSPLMQGRGLKQCEI